VNSAKFDKAPGWDDLSGWARSPWSPLMEFGKIFFTSFTQTSSVYVHRRIFSHLLIWIEEGSTIPEISVKM